MFLEWVSVQMLDPIQSFRERWVAYRRSIRPEDRGAPNRAHHYSICRHLDSLDVRHGDFEAGLCSPTRHSLDDDCAVAIGVRGSSCQDSVGIGHARRDRQSCTERLYHRRDGGRYHNRGSCDRYRILPKNLRNEKEGRAQENLSGQHCDINSIQFSSVSRFNGTTSKYAKKEHEIPKPRHLPAHDRAS